MKNSVYTTQELKWFPQMVSAGWMPKRVNHAILSGVFFLWTHKETGVSLDERKYYGGIDVLGFHLSKNTVPDKQNPHIGFIPSDKPLYRPM